MSITQVLFLASRSKAKWGPVVLSLCKKGFPERTCCLVVHLPTLVCPNWGLVSVVQNLPHVNLSPLLSSFY